MPRARHERMGALPGLKLTLQSARWRPWPVRSERSWSCGVASRAFPFPRTSPRFISLPLCAAVGAWCCARFELAPGRRGKDPVPGPRCPGRASGATRVARRVRLALAYSLWYCTFLVLPNLSLFTPAGAIGRRTGPTFGVIPAIQFGLQGDIRVLAGNPVPSCAASGPRCSRLPSSTSGWPWC